MNFYIDNCNSKNPCSTFNDRHQINHFVSTLQQYVESHYLRCIMVQVSSFPCEHKVKDMMDLESVHMEYLADSLCICFRSDETKGVVAALLEHSQVPGFGLVLRWGLGSEDCSGKLSKINISGQPGYFLGSLRQLTGTFMLGKIILTEK
ncbi:uncharacterized protein LOC124825246 [Vigna umbellata]|uniref:uncharacterized protein LOC124825246 n=1 Tax=Vigna umbellata TaxID=87088 RepID=UPI001F5F491E|nr:uncharacterized protein LOC124825246 [Vigna umbellata]